VTSSASRLSSRRISVSIRTNGQQQNVQTVLRHLNAAKGKLCHLRIPSLLMRARAQATVRVWKKRLEHQAHSRRDIREGCGLPVMTGTIL
jgi:hypothetical protein